MCDGSLRQDVVDELEFEPSLDAANIGVAVASGVVTLTGHVKSYIEKVKAEEVVRHVKGVHGIAQELEVRYPSDKKTSDDEIAKRALNIIGWDTTIPADKVQVKVEKGWVTLSGQVDWYYQRDAAENAVRRLHGIKGISNLLTIQPRAQVSDIKNRIETALKRNAELEASNIHVSVAGNTVTLDGNVKAWTERYAAENAAWATPGVNVVDNRLHVA
jgi:osmotically-inducible protein OsmY